MQTTIIKNASIVNEGKIIIADVLIRGQLIEEIAENIPQQNVNRVIEAKGLYLLPGVIDDQVHFREPGLTHKGTIYTESKAAVAGGVTSFMEMPNTVPPTTTQRALEDKYLLAAEHSLANYSFYIGATNSNLQEVLKTDPSKVCGIKIFMGSSTGDMLVDQQAALDALFSEVKMLIAVHAEEDPLVKSNLEKYKAQLGESIGPEFHPLIRTEEACYRSSSKAVEMASKYGTRLHVLHISTAKELGLFDNTLPLVEKKITAEACVHHLWFSDEDYALKGNFIKWNPAIKKASDRQAIFQAVLDGRVDVIATDHAPHTIEEKKQSYLKAPSGGPLVQHVLVAMLEFYHQGKISLETIVQKMSHNVADLFRIQKRGYIKKGYYADMVLVDLQDKWKVNAGNILYKCGWSPFEGMEFQSKITHTIVNGHLVYNRGNFDESHHGQRLLFKV